MYMFYEADSFNGDISRWDVSSVTEFNAMFYGAKSLYIWISLIEFFGCLGWLSFQIKVVYKTYIKLLFFLGFCL